MHPFAMGVGFTDTELIVTLVDGRTISVPLAWFDTLSKATSTQREDFEILGDGEGIHWPQLDEDLSVKGLLIGAHV
ncbi:MAG: DUF2442 domain-containing protein [Pseudomonadales bacterium]|nr:DUF2442 domain-containing protein [Pseudomonadales bacterium]